MNEMLEESLAQLTKRGGIYYDVSGISKKEIMLNTINKLPPDSLPIEKRNILLQAVLERETIISTGIENGIALPHPRTPMLEGNEAPFVAIVFPLLDVNWDTPDGSKVHTIFLIVSKSPKQHLGVLSKINFLCQQEDFFKLIVDRAPEEKIIAAIEEAEKNWSAAG